jgi:hypothetical protein
MKPKKGGIMLGVGVGLFLVALLIRGQADFWRRVVLQVLQPAGMILFVFSTYYSGLGLLDARKRSGGFFAGSSKMANATLLAVFAVSLVLTVLILIFSDFPLNR